MASGFAWQASEQSTALQEDHQDLVRSAAADARTIIDALVHLDHQDPVVAQLAGALAEAAALVRDREFGAVLVDDPRAHARTSSYLDRSPVTGQSNPLAPPLKVIPAGEHGARAVVSMGLAYQGPPGRLHGGFVATLLDHVMGYAAASSGKWVFTRTLSVDYDHAVPLFQDLEISAEIQRMDGRKVWVVGRISAGGKIVARATGMWVGPRTS